MPRKPGRTSTFKGNADPNVARKKTKKDKPETSEECGVIETQ